MSGKDSFDLIRFPTADELAQAVAKEWLGVIEKAKQSGATLRVALSGGRIAGRLFSAMSNLAAGRNGLLATVHFCWGDERCVPPTDPESNFRLAWERLLQPMAVPDARIHRIRGEEPPEAAAAGAAEELLRLAPGNGQGQPVLDLIFLGLGEDGHVASLFPAEPMAIINDRAVYRPVLATKPPPQRITLSYQAIAAAREVWVLASGTGKESALKASLAANGQTPLARVLQIRQQPIGRTRIYTELAV